MHPYSQHRAVRGRLRRTSYMLSVLLIGGFTASMWDPQLAMTSQEPTTT